MITRKTLAFLIVLVVAVAVLFAPQSPPVKAGGHIDTGDTAWMLTASALVLLMTPGLSFFYGGMVGLKNVVSTMLQSFIALGVISLIWVVVRLQPGVRREFHGLIGNPMTYFMFEAWADRRTRSVADDPAGPVRDVPAQVRRSSRRP